MKKSLADFASSKPKTSFIPPPKPAPQTNTKTPSNQSTQNQNFEEQIKQFQAMPKDELLKTFYNEVAKQKQNGTFDIKKLEATLSSLDAFLTPEQKKNIKELLNQIQ